jgi:hypothetical protein
MFCTSTHLLRRELCFGHRGEYVAAVPFAAREQGPEADLLRRTTSLGQRHDRPLARIKIDVLQRVASRRSDGTARATFVVVLLPLLGLILWYFLGPRDGKL